MVNDQVQFVGHATVRATLDNHHFFIDTNFSPKILGLIKRQGQLGIDLNNLPDTTALLVTHAHYDHLDLFSYKFFSQDKTIIAPRGFKSFLKKHIHHPVVELSPGQSYENESIKITAVPTKHRGFRLSGFTYTNCNGYLIQGKNHALYHPGDTAYGPHFKEIGQKFKIDVACLPIGAYRPSWIMKERHLNPAEALKAFEDLGAQTMIPIHWGSFRVAWDRVNEPIEELKKILPSSNKGEQVKILKPGESLSLLF